MGWTLTGLGVALVIVVVAGAALALRRRYCIGWQWGTRNIWNVCEEWRQRLSWLWAPREEKVGLVKSQHPTAQTIPGLYRQAGNASQNLLHSDSDLRLDAQGAFTRFEPVDRDLHPPLSNAGSTIPPQPLRPAPQPRPTPRPRPSPLPNSNTVDYLRMQEAGPGPLTPPPSLQRATMPSRSTGPSVFLFENEPVKNYGLYKAPNDHSPFRFENNTTKNVAESIQMASYGGTQNHVDSRLRYELDEERRKENKCNLYRQFDNGAESTRIRYEVHGVPITSLNGKGEEDNPSYGSYDIVQRNHMIRQHVRNDSRGSPSSFGMMNSSNATSQTIMESIYGPEALSKMLQSTQSLGNDLDHKSNEMQSIEMTPFRSSSLQENIGSSYLFRESQGLQKVSQYIQSLPDLFTYDAMNDLVLQQNQDHVLYNDTIEQSINGIKGNSDSASSPIPPPPAPPDPPKEMPKKNGPTTGERIFNTLRLVTSQSYIDASEFYNSVLSSAQQVQHFSFSSQSPSLLEDSTNNQLRDDIQNIYTENDSDLIGPDESRRSSDLYSPELNLEAHRTAQEVYNSLQNPPSSPLLLKDHNQDIYTYMTDPSFTRTSEDILNSIEQRRKSMERLNGIHEVNELDDTDSLRKRNNQEFYTALEEVQLKRILSQSLEDAFITNYTINDHNNEISPGSRRGLQGPEPEPPPDESNLKRAISCETVCSDTSVVLNDLEETPIAGHLCVGVEYERWCGRGADYEADLAVSVLEARDLITCDGQPAQDTFARVCLLPGRQIHMQTRLYRGSPSPSYQEKFSFHVDSGPTGRTLLVEVFSDESSMGGDASLIGEASLRLGTAPRAPATTWLPLTGSALPTPRLGELMFSLSYLPTAERLTLVVVKARNLHGVNTMPGDFFVKVYLLQQGKKIYKKKTSVKKGEKSPIFNEAIIFNVPTHILQNIQLRLTVAEINGEQGTNSKPHSVGHILVGPTSTGGALTHWRQMLAALRRPVAMWHPLRK